VFVAKRKSTTQRMLDALERRAEAREAARRRAERAMERELERRAIEAEKEEASRRRADEQEARRRQREAEELKRRQAREEERARKRQEDERHRAALREVERIQREQARREAEARKRREHRAVARRLREADRRSAEVETPVAEFEGLLRSRPRNLRARRPQVEQAFTTSGPRAAADLLAQILTATPRPQDCPRHCDVDYEPQTKKLAVRYELPSEDVVPRLAGYRYVLSRDAIEPVKRKEIDVKATYWRLVARTVLRALADAFDAAPPSLVEGLEVEGYRADTDRATGRPVELVLVRVKPTRATFENIVLDSPSLDPHLCLQGLGAVEPSHPHDFESVPPEVHCDISKLKLVDGTDIAAGLDSRPDLVRLPPSAFESLVRELFTAMGMEAWETQASHDEGVDAVAINPDPIVGGWCVIQAKRYRRIVQPESVRALAGVVGDNGATKGILVTTSWFGGQSRQFANRNRIQLIDGRELKDRLQKYLGLDVLLGLDKIPPGWKRRDMTG
jgi:restriction system protein